MATPRERQAASEMHARILAAVSNSSPADAIRTAYEMLVLLTRGELPSAEQVMTARLKIERWLPEHLDTEVAHDAGHTE